MNESIFFFFAHKITIQSCSFCSPVARKNSQRQTFLQTIDVYICLTHRLCTICAHANITLMLHVNDLTFIFGWQRGWRWSYKREGCREFFNISKSETTGYFQKEQGQFPVITAPTKTGCFLNGSWDICSDIGDIKHQVFLASPLYNSSCVCGK